MASFNEQLMENRPFKTIEFEKDGFKFRLDHIGETFAPWSKRHNSKVFKYNLHVSCLAKPKWRDFNFFGSISDREAGKHPRTEKDVMEIADMTMRDASTYNNANDIDEFSQELGYTKVSEAIRAYEGCKEAYNFWDSCTMPEGIEDYCELADKWQEEYDF